MIPGIKKIEFESKGFKDILFSSGVKDLVQSTAKRIQAEANAGIQGESEGFSANVIAGEYGDGRYVGFVTSTDKASAQAESEDKVLSKAVHG